MDEKLKTTLDKIVQLTRQNPEFDKELRKALEIKPSASSNPIEYKQIEQIFEYCIKRVIEEQAKNFYDSFPIEEIRPELEADFVRMEDFRRKNAFGDYCLAVYQQIENICNYITSSKDFMSTVKILKDLDAYKQKKIYNVLYGDNPYLKDGLDRLNNDKLSARDKISIVVFFLGGFWKKIFYPSDYIKLREIINDIYFCRNLNHRGSLQDEKQIDKADNFSQKYSGTFLNFYGALFDFTRLVRDGFNDLPEFKLKKEVAEITSKFPSTCFIKRPNNQQSEEFPKDLFGKIKNLKEGDKITIEVVGPRIVTVG